MMDRPRFQQFGIIGTGRVAQALALGFAPHSTALPLLWGRSPESARAVAARAGCIAAPKADGLIGKCDVVAIAVSDDALADVVADLTAMLRGGAAPFVFHVSGRSGAAVLGPLRAAGALTAAVHPAMTFTGEPENEIRRMAGARFAITGSTPEATMRARHIVALLGGTAVEIAEERRALYHAALCHASNHLVTLIAGASDALTEAGVDDPAALLAPLVRAALENGLERGFAGLSGPLLRGDHRTIGDHLDALAAFSPDLLPAYRAMARATLDGLERNDATIAPELERKLR
ncbi:Rossmann-like and DUF2520 domain-containing protein [Sphingopyxis sp. JAI128]|uniref:Rossmann-like and DUF2520 domain-containing protein n=1 Tax=Sphingopyxis sp. JAI128 TaxID=2723066 RepID=UPI00160F8AF5|nr:DUF2520 domain-containing protein [Sphingopyxis sp. JAI128]MBB6425529.1 putative short-subunit dehydrogenase-like oxidoreductase (DUF2520 family) [Sphingopyxis sp. JAI128]